MYRIARVFNIVILPILLSSCILSKEEENFVRIDPKADQNNIASLSYSYDKKSYFQANDTLWVNNKIYLRLLKGDVYDLEVLINDDIFLPFGNELRDVSIGKDNLPNTYNIITLRQRVKSGTGSLADQSGVEYAEFHSQFVLVRDDTHFVPKITSITFQDGTVRIQWNEFTRSDFQHYKIIKLARDPWGYHLSRSFTLLNQQQNFFFDTTYVGGTINYQLVINNGGDNTSETYPFNYTYSPTVLLEQTGADFNLSFTPPPFYKNVKFYTTSFYNKEYVNYTETITTSNITPDNLSMLIPGPVQFGIPVKYEIRPVAKVDTLRLGDQSLSTGTTKYGRRVKSYPGRYEHDTKESVFFCYASTSFGGNGYLYKIDDTNFTAIDSASFPGGGFHDQIIISPSGNYHYYLTDSRIIEFDPVTLSVISNTPFSSIGTNPALGVQFYKTGTTVTDDNIILFSGDERGPFPIVMDMNTNTYLFRSTNRSDQVHMSSDGLYVVVGSTIYKHSGSNYSVDQTLPYADITYRQFINQNPSQILIVTTTSMIIYDCQTKSELFSMAGEQIVINQFDQTSNKIFVTENRAAKVFDVATRTLKTVNISGSVSFLGNVFFTQSDPPSSDNLILKDY